MACMRQRASRRTPVPFGRLFFYTGDGQSSALPYLRAFLRGCWVAGIPKFQAPFQVSHRCQIPAQHAAAGRTPSDRITCRSRLHARQSHRSHRRTGKIIEPQERPGLFSAYKSRWAARVTEDPFSCLALCSQTDLTVFRRATCILSSLLRRFSSNVSHDLP